MFIVICVCVHCVFEPKSTDYRRKNLRLSHTRGRFDQHGRKHVRFTFELDNARVSPNIYFTIHRLTVCRIQSFCIFRYCLFELYYCVVRCLGSWPNTYTLSKCIAENIVKQYGQNMPICITRPCIGNYNITVLLNTYKNSKIRENIAYI